MNTTPEEGVGLIAEMLNHWPEDIETEAQCIICPPFTHLSMIGKLLKNKNGFSIGAQNCHFKSKGAFTGEISVDMLKSLDVEYIIIGHSERRHLFNESDEDIAAKVHAIVKADLKVIFCCGELLEYRKQGREIEIVEQQLNSGLSTLLAKDFKNIVIAYEPVWAIGTGETASPDQVQAMHKTIRQWIGKHWNNTIASECTILYGGSIKSANAIELFRQKDVDGGLIGGASLKASEFTDIYQAIL